MSLTTSESPAQVQSDSDTIDLGRLIGLLLDAKYLIVLVTLLFTLLGLIYSFCKTPVYQADALVQVEPKSLAAIPSLMDLTEQLTNSSGNESPQAQTEIELIKSRMILGQTVEQLKLDIQITPKYPYWINQGIANHLHWKPGQLMIEKMAVPDELQDKSFVLRPLSANRYELLYDGDEVLQGSKGQLATSKDQQTSILVTDWQMNDSTAFDVKNVPLMKAINDLDLSLGVSEQGKDTGILSLSLPGTDQVMAQQQLESIITGYFNQNVARNAEEAEKSIKFLNNQLPALRQQLDDAEQKLNDFRRKNESVNLDMQSKAMLDSMVEVETQLNDLKMKESDVAQQFTRQHPTYIALMQKQADLEKTKGQLNAQLKGMPQVQQEIVRMSRDVEVDQQLYIQLLNKVQELKVAQAGTIGNVRIIDHAAVEIKPIAPKKALIVVISFILGGMVSVAWVLLRSALNHGVEAPDELEQAGFNVYATIPFSGWQDKQIKALGKKANHSRLALLAKHDPTDLAIEALRGLRTSLHFAMLEAKNNILMISGPNPGVGKTFVSANLAAVMAQSGKKVLMIDADMRKGILHHYFFYQEHRNGLSDVLSGQARLEDSLTATYLDNLQVINRGHVPPNPSELLMHPNFNQLLQWASEHYDLVVIDTPPLLAVTDAAVVGRLAGTTMMVARFDATSVKEIEISENRLSHGGITLKGIILNGVERKASTYYSHGYHYYNDSYYRKSDKQDSDDLV